MSMPLFKARNKRVCPVDSGVEEILLDHTVRKPDLKTFRKTSAPFCLQRKFENKLKYRERMDDPEEDIEGSTLLPASFRPLEYRHSVTLPIVVPSVATAALHDLSLTRTRSDGYTSIESCSSSEESSSPSSSPALRLNQQCFWESKMAAKLNNVVKNAWLPVTAVADEIEEAEPHCEVGDNQISSSTAPQLVHDIDKLTNFKSKHKKCPSELLQSVVKWTSSPQRFYECILNHRETNEPGSDSLATMVLNNDNGNSNCSFDNFRMKHVRFAPDILLFSAIEENVWLEVENIIQTYAIDLRHCVDCKGEFPLHRAVEFGFTKSARVLLKHGADVNCKNAQNKSPLYVAFSNRQFECIVLLIEAGASIEEYTSQILIEFLDAKEKSKVCYRAAKADV